MTTYAINGSETFNRELDETLQSLAADVADALGETLVALILGGGYGRGEGAVYLDFEGPKPYNDLDLFLVVKDSRRVDLKALHRISRRYESWLGIDVDFSRPVSVKQLPTMACSLMWHDLACGHRVLYGPEDILEANLPAAMIEPPAPIESLRLLLNRGAGLLWAMRVEREIEPAPDSEFVRRNYFKVALALGDAVLIVKRRHQTAYTGRDRRYAQLEAEQPEVAQLGLGRLYEEALRFRFNPHQFDEVTIDFSKLVEMAMYWERTLLWVERQRTGQAFLDVEAYARWSGIREADNHRMAELGKNVLRNLSVARFSWRHPREWLYRQLPVLLCRAKPENAEWVYQSGKVLEVWKRFN